jgi:hypothetical protein
MSGMMPVREAIRRLEDDDSRRPNEHMQSHVDTAWERWGSASITLGHCLRRVGRVTSPPTRRMPAEGVG